MPENLLEVLDSGRVLLGDGAMGTQLQQRGLAPGTCGEGWNLDHPERVREIHERYAAAGSELLTTNTFGGSRLNLELHGDGERAPELCRAGAALARAAAGPGRWVLGDIGPFGGLLAPLGEAEPQAVLETFREQAAALLAGGADAILIETMLAIEEAELAVRAARAAGAGLVLASFAFDPIAGGGQRTMMGASPRRVCEAMLAAGADIVGCNCGTNLAPGDLLAIVGAFREAGAKRILVQPNAGQPQMSAGVITYAESPAAMAERIAELVAAGAAIVGGCCGTTPEHIAAFRKVLAR